MRALRFEQWKTSPAVVEVPEPEPQAGQVVVRVGGAGICHSDVSIIRDYDATMGFPWGPPFVLGHENAGWVHSLGPGVEGFEPGQPVAVYGLLGCNHCRQCAQGAENYCENFLTRPAGVGIGVDGGIADYLLVHDPRRLVPLGDLDPVEAAPLTDAALTPYHAITRALPRLRPGSHALVIGVGGLGHLGVQILNALSPTTVIAVDGRQQALDMATRVGAAHAVATGPDAAAAIRDATGGRGVDAVFDFVGTTDTITLGVSVARASCDVVVVGVANGPFEFTFFGVPYRTSISTSLWGTLPELYDVIALAETGRITSHVERFPLERAMDAFDRMESGTLTGRAVIVP